MSGATYGHELRLPEAELEESLRGASAVPFWLDGPRPTALPLSGDTSTDLLVMGGGYCGLWTALQAKERDPDRDVMLVEAHRIAWAASGRNGGFVEATLTHGDENGARHFAAELPSIEALGEENFDELRATLERYGIDAEWEEEGVLSVATEPHQLDALRRGGASVLEGDALRKYTRSPVVRGAEFERDHVALVHPGKLAEGLRRACLSLGVRMHERTRVSKIERRHGSEIAVTDGGRIAARQVALATNGFPSLLKRNTLRTVPIYDYVLVTEPLSAAQLEEIGWVGRHGMTDLSRQFHYYRKTADDRILWGGYDAVYHRGRRIRPAYDQRPETFLRLADHFFTAHPSLRGTRFSHAWGGMIDMSTTFVSFQGTAHGGAVAYSSGYTGLGVAATRFGAAVMLDLLDGVPTKRTSLAFSTTKPFPIPPEPVAYPVIQTMRGAIARSDADGGRDGILIRAMEAFGIGFDS
ncbi:FAD-binding oxidoreductase [Herbiconiux sp. CPCC 205716]|uniref:FAD-binding oxidoreductase n=1 Tax=Herbiconiux gentiana TaxID=2970912 RepID=A0ABT2GEQ8_9MICO|nr:FAD-dependent oxidoreductase [Herbiconiux gentiana]MCS5714672.1 FAD-binding oxidoreductase [Herbiconiux gentiana]